MRVLVLGGTVFLGRHIVAALLQRGHEVTMFNRGRENPDLFPQVRRIIGDRDGGLDGLIGETFDAVIDTCGYVPRLVGASAALLSDSAPFYTYISTMSVYRDVSRPGVTEEAPVFDEEPDTEALGWPALGPQKAASERAVQHSYGADRSLIVRCGLIFGPYDVASRSRSDAHGVSTNTLDYDSFSGRIPYWPLRVARGDRFAAPEPRDQPLQLIDARDLSEFVVRLTEARQAGIYTATGPADGTLTMSGFITACAEAAGTPVSNAVWIPEQVLVAHGLQPLTTLPLWKPTALTPVAGLFSLDCTKAIAAGLRTRPVRETLRDILDWARPDPHLAVASRTPVISPALEAELIAAAG
ncbi:NAD-dependent epimerase/dehydratase family protein [Micromonospora maritima]|uniref:UDP-glucose 4-epimerase n=1 Tax=Micromonospora maritima TaxID=986711 RepID=A0ABW7ZF80_9ACTN